MRGTDLHGTGTRSPSCIRSSQPFLDRQRLRELAHHAERVLELRSIGSFRDDDPVQRPDRVEVEVFGESGELLELLDAEFTFQCTLDHFDMLLKSIKSSTR